MTLRALLYRLIRDHRGATAIEYGLIAALIVIAMVVGLAALARSTNGMLTNVSNAVERTRPN
jgi:pilus assembly protein Flp/PilA